MRKKRKFSIKCTLLKNYIIVVIVITLLLFILLGQVQYKNVQIIL